MFSAPAPRWPHVQPLRTVGAMLAGALALTIAGAAWGWAALPARAVQAQTLPEVAHPAVPTEARPAAQPPQAAPPAGGLRPIERPSTEHLSTWLDDSVNRGLGWLIATQNPDGSWTSTTRTPLATTALVVTALAVNGSTHWRGPYREVAYAGLGYLLKRQNGLTYASSEAELPLLVLALSVLYEATGDEDLVPRIRRGLGGLGSTTSPYIPDSDPVWGQVARSAAAWALGDAVYNEERVARFDHGLRPDLANLLGQPRRWVYSSWFVAPESQARASWRGSVLVYLRSLQHPRGSWSDQEDLEHLDFVWATARNALTLGLLAK